MVSRPFRFGDDQFVPHFTEQNILNLGSGEISGQLVRNFGEQFLGGQTFQGVGQTFTQNRGNLGDQFRTSNGGLGLPLGVGLGLGFLGLGSAGLGKLGNHRFDHGLGFGVVDGVQSDGQSVFLGHSHSVSLSGF